MSESGGDMFVVRVFYRNGQMFNYLFMDVGRAQGCAADLATAKMRAAEQKPAKENQAHVFDDAGRESWVDGGQIQAVMMVDAKREVYLNTRLEIMVRRTTDHFLKLAGEVAPQPNGHAAPEQTEQPRPPVRAPNFAN